MDEIVFFEEKRIVSQRNSIVEVEPIIYRLKDKVQIKNEKFFNMLIAITEAVNNAIVHGNKCDKKKKVYFSVSATPKKVKVTVKDQGHGFNIDDVPDPLQEENILKESGRGIFLIKELCDDYSYKISPKGTKLVLTFNLNS
jgi:serine/threonine-protein kinase RsbW